MADLPDSTADAKTVAEKSSGGVASFMLICGKLAFVGVLLWACIQELIRLCQQARRGSTATTRTATGASTNVAAHVDARRRSAWEREQTRVDELAAAALAAKQKRAELQQNIRAAALAVKQAKERARGCALRADDARMRRRRAQDQLTLSGNVFDTQGVRLLKEEAEQAVRQDQIEQEIVEQAVQKLEELQRLLKEA